MATPIDEAITPAGVAEPAARRARSCLVGIVLTVASGALYLVGAGRAFDYDGSVTVGVFVRHGGPFDMFRTVYAFNNHPYFSFVEHIVWDLGGHSEAWLRLVPIACGAAAVGVLATWTAQRFGALAGAAGGCVLAANPMFADLSRSVRGYSLMIVGCVVATGLLAESLRGPTPMTRRRGAVYAIALGVAIGTQMYAVFVLAAHVATLLARRRLDAAWRRRLELTVAIGVIPYAAMLRPLLAVGRGRPGAFQPWFPIDAARALLGQQTIAVVLLLSLVLIAVVHASRGFLPAIAVVAGGLLVVWIVIHPLDLYPRFLGWLVPAVALLVACAVGRRPALVVVVVVAVVAMVASEWATWTTDPIASRRVAAIVEHARAEGQVPCAVEYSGEMVLGYTAKPRRVFSRAQAGGCDVLVAEDSAGADKLHDVACGFSRRVALPGRGRVWVYTDPRPCPF